MKQALIIIDIQEAFFLDSQQNLWNSEAIIKNINVSITWARRNEVPVIFIQHTDADDVDFALGQPGWELYHGLLRQAEDQVIQNNVGRFLSNGAGSLFTSASHRPIDFHGCSNRVLS